MSREGQMNCIAYAARTIVVALLGTGLTIAMMNSNAAAGFGNLKPPAEYFSNPQAVALLQAALSGDIATAKKLVSEGANQNDEGPMVPNANRLRLLHYAIASKNRRAVQLLIGVGADPELKGANYGTAFLFAMNLNDIEMLSLLLELRPIASLSRPTINTLLFESLHSPRPHEFAQLLLKRGIPIDFADTSGYTLLLRAMGIRDLDLAEWLLRNGASINVSPPSGVTPAYSVQEMLSHYKPDSETHVKLQRIKGLMQTAGAVFPAPDPKSVREARTVNKR